MTQQQTTPYRNIDFTGLVCEINCSSVSKKVRHCAAFAVHLSFVKGTPLLLFDEKTLLTYRPDHVTGLVTNFFHLWKASRIRAYHDALPRQSQGTFR